MKNYFRLVPKASWVELKVSCTNGSTDETIGSVDLSLAKELLNFELTVAPSVDAIDCPQLDFHVSDNGHLLMSPKMIKCLERVGVNSLQFYPCVVTRIPDGEVLTYLVADIPKIAKTGNVEVLDVKRDNKGKQIVVFDRKLERTENRLLDFLCLADDPTTILVSPYIKEALKLQNISGIEFQPLNFNDMSDDNHGFPLFLGEVKGKSHRWFGISVCFKEELTGVQKKLILSNIPRYFKNADCQFHGKMLSIGFGKILSVMDREDGKKMLEKYRRNKRKYIVPYDYTYYIPYFTSKERFDQNVISWLYGLHEICPIRLVVRDESDLGKYRYPGGEWSLVSDQFICWHEESVGIVNDLLEDISNDPEIFAQKGMERRLFANCILSLIEIAHVNNKLVPSQLEEYIIGKTILLHYIKTYNVQAINRIVRLNFSSSFIDVVMIRNIGEIVCNELKNGAIERRLEINTIFSIVKDNFRFSEVWEIWFGDGYTMSLLAKEAALYQRKDILELILQFIKDLKVWGDKYVRWIGYKAEELLNNENYHEAFSLYKLILNIDVDTEDIYECYSVYANALWLIVERNSGLKIDDKTIKLFLNRSLVHAKNCSAIYANAALVYIQQGDYRKALDLFEKVFNAGHSRWPVKRVNLDNSVFSNALWILNKENTGLKVSKETINFFITKCLPHAQENPTIYCHACYLCIQLGDFERACDFYLQARDTDSINYYLMTKEIVSLPFLAEFNNYLEMVHNE